MFWYLYLFVSISVIYMAKDVIENKRIDPPRHGALAPSGTSEAERWMRDPPQANSRL